MTATTQPPAASPLSVLLGTIDVVDPYPLWQSLLDGPPLLAPDGGWAVVTRHADCAALLRDPRASSDPRHGDQWKQHRLPQLSAQDLARMDKREVFLFRDAPVHTRLRRLVSRAFTARTVERLAPFVQATTTALLDAAWSRGRLEVVRDIAYPLPVAVISEMLGVPQQDHAVFAGWSEVLARGLDGLMGQRSAEETATQLRASEEFRAYFADLVQQRRAAPREDLLSELVRAEEAGDRLTEDELISTAMLLLIAGHETTVSLISNGVLALLRVPGLLARVREDASLLEGLVEEVLRLDPPVQMTQRTALEAIELPGGTLRAGGTAVLLLAAAGRDGAAFPRPDVFDPSRGDSRHLAFGAGAHYCLGAPLARLEGRVVLGQLVRRWTLPELGELAYRDNRVLRGPSRLEVLDPSLTG